MSGHLYKRPAWREAIYRKVHDPDERGNPYIEALPPVWSKAEIMSGLVRYLDNFTEMRTATPEQRIGAMNKVRFYYQPSKRDVDLLFEIVTMIRSGYLNRNPIGMNYVSSLKRGIAALADVGYDPLPEPTATGGAVIGVSGVGKTTSVRVALECIPRVIRHTQYGETPFFTHQLVWLKINCPKSGSVRQLCQYAIEAADLLLGETFARKYNVRRASREELESALAAIANVHGLGLLVIDEIQNLARATSKDRAVILTFLTNLMNGIGVPVLFVGTKDAMAILRDAVPTARRTAGALHRYERFKPDADFALFMEGLWEYQLVDLPVELGGGATSGGDLRPGELTPWMALFYHYSQGIPDIAVKLFCETQKLALMRSIKGGSSTITAEFVREAWETKFKTMHGHIEMIRAGREPQEPGFGESLVTLGRELEEDAGLVDPWADPTEGGPLPGTGEPLDADAGDNELPDGMEQPHFTDANHPLDDVVGQHLPPPMSKAARARALGASATKAALARAARKKVQSSLDAAVDEGTAEGLEVHEAIRAKGRKLS